MFNGIVFTFRSFRRHEKLVKRDQFKEYIRNQTII